jgi:negative regulator of flagellin synthesis FlgM
MQIFGPSQVQGARSITESLKTAAAEPTTRSIGVDTVDQLDLSREAQSLMQTGAANEIRSDRVADIRAQIASGRYETAEKLSAAVNRMLDEMA